MSIGFNITLPQEQRPNTWSTPELSFRFHYFAMRKMHLAMRANALVVFPGGFGTMDELFEMLTLRQTDKAPRIPIVLADRDYWQSIIDFERLVELGMVEKADLDLFGYAEDAEGIWSELLARGLTPHSSIELAAEPIGLGGLLLEHRLALGDPGAQGVEIVSRLVGTDERSHPCMIAVFIAALAAGRTPPADSRSQTWDTPPRRRPAR